MALNKQFKYLILLLIFTAGNIYSRNLNVQSGLSNNYIHTIYKDSSGLLWFGTETGLDRFDGEQIISYNKRFKKPLKGAVQSILELNNNKFIIATSWGAFVYDIHENKISPLNFQIPSIDTRCIFKSSNGRIYIASDNGLYIFNPTNLSVKRIALSPVKYPALNYICQDKNGEIWIAGKDFLCKITDKQNYTIQFTRTDCGNIHTIKSIGDMLYLATDKGLYRFGTKKNLVKLIQSTKGITVSSIAFDHNKTLYLGTDNAGILTFNISSHLVQKFEYDNNISSITSKNICALCFAHNILIAGTFDNGVDIINLQKSKIFKTIDFVNTYNVTLRSGYFSKDGLKYLGTRDGKFFCLYHDNKLKYKIDTNENPIFHSKIITRIFPYPGSSTLLLIGTFNSGIYIFDTNTKKFRKFSDDANFRNCTVYNFCTDNNGQFWIGTLNGLYKYNLTNNTYIKYNTLPITGSNEIFTLCSDRNGKIWIGTKTGICYLSLSANKIIQPTSVKPFKYQCTASYVDKSGNSWFCFNKGGVLKLNNKLQKELWLTSEIALPENAPSSLIQDKRGNIWFGSSKGLFVVNQKDEIKSYGLDDGLTGIAFCPESAVLDSHGNLWWSNEKGLVTFLNDSTTEDRTAPKILFTDFFINGTHYDADTLTFIKRNSDLYYEINIHGKSNNNLEFRVSSLNYLNPQKDKFSYRLLNRDTLWSHLASNNIIAFNKLKSGSYILQIKAENNNGIISAAPLEIRFSIIPYFYETYWFIAVLIIIVATLALYFMRGYVRKMRIKLGQQFEELKEKQRSNNSNTLKISDQRANEIKEALNAYMTNDKPYLNTDLRQADVAKETGFPVHEISMVLNSQLDMSFPDFVNSYRVEEVKLRMQTDDAKKYTLTAVAVQCGFSGKSSFLRAFKKATGMTPSEYFKRSQEK